MKEIKKRASDDIQVKKIVRNVRNRMIAKCHILYTQGGKQSAVVPKTQLIRRYRNQKLWAHTGNYRMSKIHGAFLGRQQVLVHEG
jgi:hypothetical protein